MKALSLFSGIGGIDLACEWAGIETVAFCEREPFPQQVLRKHWPDVPIYDDVCTLTKERLEADGIGPIDLIHGGYPCQPFSHAGKRKGKEDDRHLWPEVRRLIEAIRPRWFVGENVAGHITLGLDDVLSDLGDLGYTAQPFVIPACSVNAPHRRDRVFIVAHSNNGFSKSEIEKVQAGWTSTFIGCGDVAYAEGERCGEAREYQSERAEERPSSSGQIISYSASAGLSIGRRSERTTSSTQARTGLEPEPERRGENVADTNEQHDDNGGFDPSSIRWERSEAAKVFGGEPDGGEQWSVEPDVGRVANGVPNRVDRLKALGNAVVPQQIYPVIATIKQIDDLINPGGTSPPLKE